MRVIAFTGPKTCGKDTAAKCLFKHNYGDRRQYFLKKGFAEGVKNYSADFFGWTHEQMDDPVFKETPIALWEGGPVIEPRWFMMDEANGLRDRYHPEIHARRWERHIKREEGHWGAIVIPDLRFPDEELPAIRRQKVSLVVYIHRDEAEEKLALAQANMDPKALNASEAHYKRLRAEADIVLTNNGAIHELHNAVNQAVHVHFGHWINWPEARKNNLIGSLVEEDV